MHISTQSTAYEPIHPNQSAPEQPTPPSQINTEISQLPQSCLEHVFKYLNSTDSKGARLTCRQFNMIHLSVSHERIIKLYNLEASAKLHQNLTQSKILVESCTSFVNSNKTLYLKAAKLGLIGSLEAIITTGKVPPHDDVLNCQTPDFTIPDFLTLLLEGSKDVVQKLNYIELFFLHNISLTKVSPSITREDLDASYSFLSQKYSSKVQSVNAFYMQAFSLNKDHLKTGCSQHEIPQKVPNNVQIGALQTLFDSIEWEKENLPKIYQYVFEKAPEFQENPQTKLQETLHFFLTRLANKEPFIGTPSNSYALNEFYANIELALRHSCATLLEKRSNEHTLRFIKELLRSSRYCGGTYFQTAINQYLLICKETIATPRVLFENLLAEYRKLCFEGVVTEMTQGSLHGLTNALRDLGEELGIRESHMTFNDMYSDASYTKESARETFFKAYTPYSIVFDYFLPLLSHSAKAAGSYIDLHKEIIPSWWNQEKYQGIHDELQTLSSPSLAPEEKTQKENEILEKYNIIKAPKMSAQASVEEDRRSDYLKNFVHGGNGKNTFFGLVYALERLGIIQCSLPYKDGSKKVEPLLPQQEVSQKTSLIKRIISSAGSFFGGLFS